MKNLDPKVVKEIAQSNMTSEAFFLALSLRERNREEIDVGRTREQLIHEGFKVVTEDLIDTMKRLDKAGVGQLVLDKVGKPVRFKWHFGLKEVAKAGLEGLNIQKLVKAKTEVASKPITQGSNTTVVIMSDKRKATITVPADLTEAEARIIFESALLRRA